jgi:hypothetical protein
LITTSAGTVELWAVAAAPESKERPVIADANASRATKGFIRDYLLKKEAKGERDDSSMHLGRTVRLKRPAKACVILAAIAEIFQ